MSVVLLGWITDILTLDVLLYELAHHRFHLRKAIAHGS